MLGRKAGEGCKGVPQFLQTATSYKIIKSENEFSKIFLHIPVENVKNFLNTFLGRLIEALSLHEAQFIYTIKTVN